MDNQDQELQEERNQRRQQTGERIKSGYDTLRRGRNLANKLKRARTAFTAARTAGTAAATSEVWAPILIIGGIIFLLFLFLFLIILILFITGDYDQEDTADSIPGLTISLTGPNKIDNGQNIEYVAHITYTGNDDITIIDPIPSNATFVSATEPHTVNASNIIWKLNSLQPEGAEGSASAKNTFPQTLFQRYGFPAPTTPTAMTPDELARYKTYFMPHAVKAAEMIDSDAGLVGLASMWAWIEDHFNTYMDNCNDSDFDPNSPCPYFGREWQVGYGNHPRDEIENLKEAIEKMYPASTSIQSIGQRVIDQSKTRDTRSKAITFEGGKFPSDVTIDMIVNGYIAGDRRSHELAGILFKDDAIGTYLVVKKFKTYVDNNGVISIADRMESWSSSYYNRQKVVNLIAGVYNAGFNQLSGTRRYTLHIVLKPTEDNTVIDNYLEARAAGIGRSATGLSFLPATESTEKADAAQKEVAELLYKTHPSNVEVYQQASEATGVPWQVLAGLHYREGNMGPDKSLVSGRTIGQNEPDIVISGGCSQGAGPGKPIPLPGGGCGFRTLLDSAIYAGNHLKGKNGGEVPADFAALVKSFSYYNGGGNANCNPRYPTPYAYCPPEFTGEDDTYVMNLYDRKHEQMFIIFCADFTACDPTLDRRLGAASAMLGVSRFAQ